MTPRSDCARPLSMARAAEKPHGLSLVLLAALLALQLSSVSAAVSVHKDVWNEVDLPYDFVDSTACTIDRVPASLLSGDDFARLYLEKQPVILRSSTSLEVNAAMRRAVQKKALLAAHGNDTVTLSTGNRDSYRKLDVSLSEYIAQYMLPQSLAQRGADTWYHFGDPHHLRWSEIQHLYQPPLEYMTGMTPSLSFGVASSGSGVPFHVHGHVFAEVLYGRKRWWITPPHHEPRFDPDESSLQWLHNVRPTYTPREASQLMECVCEVGDIIYIPTNWYHATLNLGETVFMSVFV